jgi:glutamate synthase (NADPH/NADH) large chain
MMRKCHLNTCPVGVATQDPELRKRFTGKPEHVVRFLRFMAAELREHMAALGFRTVDEMVGRVDMLNTQPAIEHWKAKKLDLSALLIVPGEHKRDQISSNNYSRSLFPRRCVRPQEHEVDQAMDQQLIRRAAGSIERGEPVEISLPVRNVNRTIGATLSGEITRKHGPKGLPTDTIKIKLTGSAGQSLGAFLAPGVTITVAGDANDYVGKGLSGGRIALRPPPGATFEPHESILCGNVVLYGATAGELFVNGLAGERFAVRNSGASAVVEGVGDHGCEYMTGGVVVVLGPTGNNFAAGMSGGVAYIYDESELFDTRCNLDMVDIESVWKPEDVRELHGLIRSHFELTGSPRAKMILENWEAHLPTFVKVMPIEYRRVLERMRLAESRDPDTVSATEEVYSG